LKASTPALKGFLANKLPESDSRTESGRRRRWRSTAKASSSQSISNPWTPVTLSARATIFHRISLFDATFFCRNLCCWGALNDNLRRYVLKCYLHVYVTKVRRLDSSGKMLERTGRIKHNDVNSGVMNAQKKLCHMAERNGSIRRVDDDSENLMNIRSRVSRNNDMPRATGRPVGRRDAEPATPPQSVISFDNRPTSQATRPDDEGRHRLNPGNVNHRRRPTNEQYL